jgi:predicted metalloprotease with PDZ domain
MTVLKKFKLGPYKFRKVPIYIFEDEFNVTSYPHLGGLIGNDLLRRFNIVINYPHSEFHLIPNIHFRDLFDYAYTGLGLYYLGDKIVIYDIIKDSPADQAGLMIGDEVVGIDNNLSNNIQVYKAMLQSTGSRLRVIVRRDGDLVETKMTVKSIL